MIINQIYVDVTVGGGRDQSLMDIYIRMGSTIFWHSKLEYIGRFTDSK